MKTKSASHGGSKAGGAPQSVDESQLVKQLRQEVEDSNKEHQKRMRLVLKEMKAMQYELDKHGVKYRSKVMTEQLRAALTKSIHQRLVEHAKSPRTEAE